jgi:tripartite-type tricarboxylate transporter receptor subunit TctC
MHTKAAQAHTLNHAARPLKSPAANFILLANIGGIVGRDIRENRGGAIMMVRVLALLGIALLPVAAVQGQGAYPSRPVTIVIPFTAGGTMDVIARLVRDGLRDRLGQPFVVENRAGAAGIVGTAAVARAEPDGHTLLVSPNTPLVFNPLTKKSLPYDPEALVPVIQLGSQPLVLAVRGNFPASSFQAFIEHAKASPGKLNYSSQGVGGGNHLSALLLQQVTGTHMVHIPYSGEPPARQALVSGEVDFFMAPMAGMLPLYREGRVKILAVGSTTRVAELPDVPTFRELGYPEELVLTVWYALMAPPKTPDAIVERLNKAVNEIVRQPEAQERYRSLAIDPVGGTPRALKGFLDAELRRWTAVVEAAQIPKE